jgi:hypothetical protein
MSSDVFKYYPDRALEYILEHVRHIIPSYHITYGNPYELPNVLEFDSYVIYKLEARIEQVRKNDITLGQPANIISATSNYNNYSQYTTKLSVINRYPRIFYNTSEGTGYSNFTLNDLKVRITRDVYKYILKYLYNDPECTLILKHLSIIIKSVLSNKESIGYALDYISTSNTLRPPNMYSQSLLYSYTVLQMLLEMYVKEDYNIVDRFVELPLYHDSIADLSHYYHPEQYL